MAHCRKIGIFSKECKCPASCQNVCRTQKKPCQNINKILEVLNNDMFDQSPERGARSNMMSKSRRKKKAFRPRHYKDTCVPMKPSMHTRLRYISHCPLLPPPCPRAPRPRDPQQANITFYDGRDKFGIDSEDDQSAASSKRRRHDECSIFFTTPAPFIKHTESNKSIIKVPSPKTSGEVVQVKRASVKPGDIIRPPLPAQSGHALIKPHSGIILNETPGFIPDGLYMPGGTIEESRIPCYKGKTCRKAKCSGKKCRHYAAMLKRKRRASKQRRKGRFGMVSSSRLRRSGRSIKKLGRRQQKYYDGDDDLCGINTQKMDHPHKPQNFRRGALETHSLTVMPCTKDKRIPIHYGILTASVNMFDNKFGPRSKGRQALPMSVMAYCLAFHYHPKQWTTKLLDNLLDAGDTWYLQLLDKVHDHSAVQGMCEVLPFGKKQIFVLNGKKMQVLLGEPDILGYTMSMDPKVYNLCRGLKAFFLENRAGILLSRILKVAIWKDNICYYIFDPAGRDNRARSNFASGAAALIAVKDLNAVTEVILARSILDDQKFVLAPVKMLKMADEKSEEDFDSEPELTQTEKALMSYRLLNENCAIVNANMHLGDRCFEESKNRQALTIAIAAMTYAKISPPNTWFTKTLDKILRMGNKLYIECLPYKQLADITIDNIPNEINLGPYTCEIIIYRERISGQLFTTKECILNIKTGLEEFFNRDYNSGILEFNNYYLAIWRQKDMYYLFDCYPRTTDGSRSINVGKACCLMLLNPSVMADVYKKNWDYLPPTTPFFIHAFKVLKLKKKVPKNQIVCTLSEEILPVGKARRKLMKTHSGRGDSVEKFHNILPMENYDDKNLGIFNEDVDEEKMGDIISLVDSIQEDYLPPIPVKYKHMPPEPAEMRITNLDSPTISVTQMVPPWPKPRDKTNEPPEPDPDPEPTPPPTPPELPPPEGGAEEAEEEEDEETMERKKEEEAKRKAEEEEARRKAEELPPPLPPPPPTPQSELEVPLAEGSGLLDEIIEEELQTAPPANVQRRILLTEDAQVRSKLRELRKKMTPPLTETKYIEQTPSEELLKRTNFTELPDGTAILRGKEVITGKDTADILPFVAIMAVVTSFKYIINTWSSEIVNFIINTAKMLHHNKKERFQLSPVHIIPKIAIGRQAYAANIDVIAEGPSWNMEEVLQRSYLDKYDRGMLTTPYYSCAFFVRNGLYYLYDGNPCNALGIRDFKEDGKACFIRFKSLHDMVARIQYNKDNKDDQQFIVSRILVRRLLTEPRLQLPEDYDYGLMAASDPKSKFEDVDKSKTKVDTSGSKVHTESASIELKKKSTAQLVGYKQYGTFYKILGTADVSSEKSGGAIMPCHFISLIAMLMATMHPIRTWTPQMIDMAVEKGHEIAQKTTNFGVCEKRVIKNLQLQGKIFNINIKKIVVINKNPDRTLEQYVKAVMRRLRYVIIELNSRSMVICNAEGYYHLFDPYSSTKDIDKQEDVKEVRVSRTESRRESKDKKKRKDSKRDSKQNKKHSSEVASWTLYRSLDMLIDGIKQSVKSDKDPSFYTFELTSVKNAPRYASYYYKLSPYYQPEVNPNTPYLKPRKQMPLVDEKMYWLELEPIPWSRMNLENDLGIPRKTPASLWKNWDIELPGDLYSVWGTLHPTDSRFEARRRGKQYLATCVVALAMTEMCDFDAWTASFLDGVVTMGDQYHANSVAKIGEEPNYELNIEDLDESFEDKYPFSFKAKFNKIIFGFMYNLLPDRFNLSNALAFFFESNDLGILVSPRKNLAFGINGNSYFMYDCQSFGAPLFCPGQGGSYVLKCESLNRLIYCMTITLNIKNHNQQFHLYAVHINVKEK